MKVHAAVILLLAFIFINVTLTTSTTPAKTKESNGSGVLCISCAVAMRALEQYIVYKEPDIEKALSKFCDLFDPKIGSFCKLFVQIEAYVN